MLLRIGICLLILVSIDVQVSAQFFDDFSNPNISGRYTGNVQDFRVTSSEELQLNAPSSGSAYLSRPMVFPDSFLWEIYFRLEFDPSSSNRVRIWIASDQEFLENGDGLYFEIGESLNTDAIRLFRRIGNSRSEIAAGEVGRVAFNPAQARVKCTYNAQGILSIWTDYSGNNDFTLEFETPIPKDLFEGTRHTGFHCSFTESRRTSYFLDDFKVDELTNDIESPRIVSINPMNSKLLAVQFSETIDTSMLTNVSTSLFPLVGALTVQTWQGNSRYCGIALENGLNNGGDYSLQISGIQDIVGNIMGDTTVHFNYLEYEVPDPYDVLFTELMVKPKPEQGLPGEEYIEIYNRSDKFLQLADFNILDGSTYRNIDSCVLLPGEFAVLVSRNHRLLFENFGKVATMSSFPALTDSGKRLALYYQNSLQVDWISYTDTWYRSTEKGSGGFSLEMINPREPCALSRNWIASTSAAGGTPSKVNSVWQQTPDTLRPTLEYVYMASSGNELEMFWDKKLDPFTVNRLASYSVEELNVSQVLWDPLAPSQAILRFQNPASSDQVYTIFADRIADCEGLTAGDMAASDFSRPVPIDKGQLIVNEVLFYPETGGSRYVELFNNSPNYVDLSTLFIADFSTSTTGRSIEHKRLLKPGGLVAFGSDPLFLSSRYMVPDTAWILPFAVPTLSDREGNVTVYTFSNSERIVLDSVNFSRSMHYPLLSDKRGVSIERLSADGPSNERSNWYSASEKVGYGTPGYNNSQIRTHELTAVSDRITILTPYFSPNQDGYLDRMELYYDLEKPGFSARVEVFDLQGNRVKVLADQELLGARGFMTWDGSNEEGRLALMGIYAIIAEMVHPDGDIIRFKKSCTLVGQLD